MSLRVFKSKEGNDPHWLIYELNEEETKYEFLCKLPVGQILVICVNKVMEMSNEGKICFYIDEELKDQFSKLSDSYKSFSFKNAIDAIQEDEYTFNKKEYLTWCEELINVLNTKNEIMSSGNCNRVLMECYEKFKWFALNYAYKFSLSKNHDETDHIIFLKHTLTKDNSIYDVYDVSGFYSLFNMDLYECLFNENAFSVKKCEFCNRYFFTNDGKRKYCDECKGNKVAMNAVKQDNINKDPIQKGKRAIWSRIDYLFDGDERKEEKARFKDQVNYYKKKLNKKFVEPNPEYDKELPEVRSKEDIVDWCKSYNEKLIQRQKEEEDKWLNQ